MTTPLVYSGTTITVPRISAFSHCFPPSLDPRHNEPAFIDATTDTQITRGEVKDKALRLAHSLLNLASLNRGADLTQGSSFLLLSPNHLLFPVVTLASLASGVPVACASAASVPKELLHILNVTKASFYVLHPALLPVLVGAMKLQGVSPSDYVKRTVVLFAMPNTPKEFGTLNDLIEAGKPMAPIRFDGENAKTTCTYFMSSGTTGLPKAVEISHLNINAQAVSTANSEMFWPPGRCIGSTPLPLFHVAAGMHSVFYPLSVATPIVIWSAPAFSLEAYVAGLAKYKVTTTSVAPPIIAALTVHPAVAKADLSRLDRLLCGAAPISGYLLKKCSDRIKPIAGPNFLICSAYGMSETCSAISTGVEAIKLGKWDSIGPLNPGVHGRIFDVDKGRDADKGDPGELWLKGDCIMNGYLGNPKATEDTLTKDGWLKTGDVARFDDDGYMYLVDRQKELIKYNGFQVPPAELEATLTSHPAVADAGVIGVMSPDGSTELPKAYISLRDPSQLNNVALPNEIIEWIKGRVAPYKQLRGGVALVQTIPRSAAGKILRKDLRILEKQLAGSRKGSDFPSARL
ncbi:acetyl-CoA synthetase-like protein [Clavulina sp. PMI_390]|nr:acetyl-CoA synthetase-like protein [Clavulina sp. PMI_390]